MNDGNALLGRAERIVEAARSRGVEMVEAYLERGQSLSVELENGALATSSASIGSGGAVRVVKGGRLGFAYFTLDSQAPAAIDAALRNARLATVPDYALPSGPKPRPMADRWHDAVASATSADAVRLADELLAGARASAPQALVSGGGVGLESGLCAIASSEGIACWDRSTAASCAASLVLPDGASSISTSESASSHRLDLDARAVGAKAGETAMSLRNPTAVAAGGRFDLVLRPEVAAELVADWMVSAATGDDAARGKTVWSNQIGAAVAHDGLSLVDDPFAAGALGAVPFDDEGLAVERLPIVENGILRSYLFDSWDAHRNGAQTTKSGVRGDFKTRPTTGTHHLVLSSRCAQDMDRLIGGIDHGFLLESVLGAHTANVTTGDFSVTSPNVWRIEAGAIAGPVRDIAVAGSLPRLLAHADGVSTETKSMMGLRMPALRLRNVDVSV